MFSSLNRWNNRVNTSWDMNANTYTGGGYRSVKRHSSISHALIVTDNIRGYVYPVIYNVFFRQHRRMLSFLRACIRTPRYMAAGDGKVSL